MIAHQEQLVAAEREKHFHRLVCFLTLAVLCALLYLPGFSSIPPVDRDEARFAQATRQMLETGDFVQIRFQQEHRYKKPAGIHWLQSAAVLASGRSSRNSIWPYRLPSFAGALLAVMLTFFMATRFYALRPAFLGTALLAGSALLVFEAHLATADAALLSAVVAAQASLAVLYTQFRKGRVTGLVPSLVFWGAQAAGIMLKGPVVPVCSLVTIVSLAVADREWRWLKRLNPAMGLPLTACLVFPWIFAVQGSTGENFFLRAFASDLWPKLTAGRESHGFPPGYYLLLALFTFWPGSLFLLPAVSHAWRLRHEPLERFCLAWIIPCWLLLECVPTKLPHYILPVYPALGLLLASLFSASNIDQHGRLRAALILWTAAGIAMLAGLFLLQRYFKLDFPVLTAALAATVLLIISGCAAALKQQRVRQAATVCVLGALFLFVPVFGSLLPRFDSIWLSRSILQAVQKNSVSNDSSGANIGVAGYWEPSLIFLGGSATKLLWPQQAAQFLCEEPGRIGVVLDEWDASFRYSLTQRQGSAAVLETIRGYNYSKGRWETVRLYTARPAVSSLSGR
ncbi:MAG TPA: glycosyltransferase family 39 protein [Acidobacteriota bacterium]|jgi:4-amino-4-deoxy-L-arabinose transferase-like glycosyltransferase